MIDVLIRFCDAVHYYPIKFAELIFDCTAKPSRLRQYIVDTVVLTGLQHWLDEGSIPEEMWVDVGKRFFELKSRGILSTKICEDYTKEPCKYHCHGRVGRECYLSKSNHLYP